MITGIISNGFHSREGWPHSVPSSPSILILYLCIVYIINCWRKWWDYGFVPSSPAQSSFLYFGAMKSRRHISPELTIRTRDHYRNPIGPIKVRFHGTFLGTKRAHFHGTFLGTDRVRIPMEDSQSLKVSKSQSLKVSKSRSLYKNATSLNVFHPLSCWENKRSDDLPFYSPV